MNVVDTLVTVLRLDNRQQEKAAKESQDTIRKTRTEMDRAARDMDVAGSRAANSFRGLRNEVVGLFLAFTGANSLRQFAAELTNNDAATGRLAANLGIATEQLSAWQGAIKRVGGDAKDADAALSSMAAAFQNFQLTGSTGHDADFQGLGVSMNDLRDPATALLKIAEAGERMSRPEFVNRLQRIGLSPSAINLLERGRSGVERLVAEQRRLGTATDESARTAQEFQDSMARLETSMKDAARPAIIALTGAFNDLAADKEGVKSFFDGVASGLSTVGRGFSLVRASLADFATMWRQIRAGDWAGAWNTFSHGEVERVANAPTPSATGAAGPTRRASGLLFERLIQQESGGRAGIAGPMTPYGQAHGLTQMLDGTARQMAAKLGIAWRPDLMRSASAEGAAYQRRLGEAYLNEGLTRYGGDERKALMFYHGGPNERMWGPKTNAYANSIMSGVRPGSTASRGAVGSTSQTTSVGQITIYTAATDAQGIARDVRGAIAQRGLVVQAGSGVNP